MTPGRCFRALGVRLQRGTCFALVRRIVADAGITFTCPEPLATVADGGLSAPRKWRNRLPGGSGRLAGMSS